MWTLKQIPQRTYIWLIYSSLNICSQGNLNTVNLTLYCTLHCCLTARRFRVMLRWGTEHCLLGLTVWSLQVLPVLNRVFTSRISIKTCKTNQTRTWPPVVFAPSRFGWSLLRVALGGKTTGRESQRKNVIGGHWSSMCVSVDVVAPRHICSLFLPSTKFS